jgi:hypothetical protein
VALPTRRNDSRWRPWTVTDRCIGRPGPLPAEPSAPEIAQHEEHDEHDDHDRHDVQGLAAFHGGPRQRTSPGWRNRPPWCGRADVATVRAGLLFVMTVGHLSRSSPEAGPIAGFRAARRGFTRATPPAQRRTATISRSGGQSTARPPDAVPHAEPLYLGRTMCARGRPLKPTTPSPL